jgi:hypothetical protein
MQPLVTKLRNEILPALVPFRIACVEAAYTGNKLEALQFRDAKGMRVTRESIPATLLASLKTILEGFLPNNDVTGQGVISIDLGKGVLTRKHQGQDTESVEESECPL